MGDVRVLVVDDDVDYRLLLRMQLELEPGLDVVGEAGDGIEALEAVARDAPDVMVLDLMMPRMDGFEAIVHLQRDHPEVGVVAYTAVPSPAAQEHTSKYGVTLLRKSGDITRLASELRDLAARRKSGAAE